MPPRGVTKGTKRAPVRAPNQLGIEGRSKMNETQLARAVGRKAK
jgi:hypothetical protein